MSRLAPRWLVGSARWQEVAPPQVAAAFALWFCPETVVVTACTPVIALFHCVAAARLATFS